MARQYISYLGSDNNTYTVSGNGLNPSTDAYTQYIGSDSPNNTINAVLISYLRQLAESQQVSDYPLYVASTDDVHYYMKAQYNNGDYEWVPDTIEVSGETVRLAAHDMPKYLTGWLAKNINTNEWDNFNYSSFNSNLYNYFVNDNIDLYGNWDNVNLMRVIVFIPPQSYAIHTPFKYDVSINSPDSYINENGFSSNYLLTENFKSIVDNQDYDNLQPYNFTPVDEYGNGNGCPTKIQGNDYSTYFGVLNNQRQLSITIEDNFDTNFIPMYDYDTSVRYYCYGKNYLVRVLNNYDKSLENNRVYLSHNTDSGHNKWTTTGFSHPNNNDFTLIVPIRRKPAIHITTHPIGAGTSFIYFTNNPDTHYDTFFYMPGDTCHVKTTPSDPSSYTFMGFYHSDGTLITSEGLNMASFIVKFEEKIIAKYQENSPTPPPTPSPIDLNLSMYCYIGLDSGSAGYSINGSALTPFSNMNPITINGVGENDTVVLRANNLTRDENDTIYCMLDSFKQYFGDDRDPSTDETLSGNGEFGVGGNYSVSMTSGQNDGSTITLTNLQPGGSYKIYAFYRPISV